MAVIAAPTVHALTGSRGARWFALLGVAASFGACAKLDGGIGGAGTGGGAAHSGGASGSGGSSPVTTGGAPGSGGQPGSGGSSASGGNSAGSTGGRSSSGGASGGSGGPGSGGGIASSGGMPGSGGAVGSGGGGGGVARVDLKGKKVLFIVDDPASLSAGDMMLKDIMAVSKDMDVTMGDTTAAHPNAAAMNLIVASSGASGSEFPALYKAAAVPMILFGNTTYQAMGFITASAGRGTVSTPVMLSIQDGATPLAAAIPMGSTFMAIGTMRNTSVYWGIPGGSPIKIAGIAAVPTQLLAFAYEKGAALAMGTAPARRVALGFKTDVIGDLSVESFKLVNAAIEWTAGAPP